MDTTAAPTDLSAANVPTRLWELRVHGVSNTPPATLLLTWTPGVQPVLEPPEPVVLQLVAGDSTTGFWRRLLPRPPADEDVTVEAYSWGQLTSGARGVADRASKDLYRAAWTLLLPFALVNAALWARPRISLDSARTAGRGIERLLGFLVRLNGLALTCTLVLAALVVGDVVVVRCGAGCARKVPLVGDLIEHPWLADGARLAAPAVLPAVLVVAVLWLLSQRTFQYEAVTPSLPEHEPAVAAARPSEHPFEDPAFWAGRQQAGALRSLHLAVALTTVTVVLAAAVLASEPTPIAGWLGRLLLVVSAIVLALAIAGLEHPRVRTRSVDSRPNEPALASLVLAVAAAAAVGALGLVLSGAGTTSWAKSHAGWPAVDAVILGVFGLQLVVVLVTWGLTRYETGRVVTGAAAADADAPAWGGSATTVFLGAAWAIGALYSTAIVYATRQWITGVFPFAGGAEHPTTPQADVPDSFRGAAASLTVCVLLLVAIALIGFLRLRSLRARARSELRARTWDPPLDPHEEVRLEAVAAAQGVHRLVGYDAFRLVGWLGALTLVVMVTLGVVTGWVVTSGSTLDRTSGVLGVLATVGEVLGGLVMVVLVAVAGLVYRSKQGRESIGVVWDVVTFWPRGAHPFAPPSYAECAVPQLITRIATTKVANGVSPLDDPLVVLATHSQGAVLATAALFGMQDATRKRVFLLTFGIQLTRFYGRAFPAFFGRPAREVLARRLGGIRTTAAEEDVAWQREPLRWRSLWRDTDYLGWPIGGTPHAEDPGPDNPSDALGEAVDLQVQDPALDEDGRPALRPESGEVLDPPIRQHSGYPLSREYVTVRDEGFARLAHGPGHHGSDPSTTGTSVPPPPDPGESA